MERCLAAGEAAALRFAVPEGEVRFDDAIRGPITIAAEEIGDFIILRSDGMPSYNFAAVVDDAAMAVTHIIRGDDHLTNTARQELLRRALYAGRPAPVYAHHAMILAPGGGKLSKRHGATAVGEYRELGYLPQAIVNYLALLSWSHGDDEVLGLDRLVATFELSALSASPAMFDMAKLDWLNHQWIMALPTDAARTSRRRAAAGRHAAGGRAGARRGLQALARALQRAARPLGPRARQPRARRRGAPRGRRRPRRPCPAARAAALGARVSQPRRGARAAGRLPATRQGARREPP